MIYVLIGIIYLIGVFLSIGRVVAFKTNLRNNMSVLPNKWWEEKGEIASAVILSILGSWLFLISGCLSRLFLEYDDRYWFIWRPEKYCRNEHK